MVRPLQDLSLALPKSDKYWRSPLCGAFGVLVSDIEYNDDINLSSRTQFPATKVCQFLANLLARLFSCFEAAS